MFDTHSLHRDGPNDLYGHVESVARQIEEDERLIKNRVMVAIDEGQTDLALRMLRAWCITSPRDVIAQFLEGNDGQAG